VGHGDFTGFPINKSWAWPDAVFDIVTIVGAPVCFGRQSFIIITRLQPAPSASKLLFKFMTKGRRNPLKPANRPSDNNLSQINVKAIRLPHLLLALGHLTVVHEARAQGTRFFRISGPAPTTTTAFNPDGTLVWSNAHPGTNYTIQAATSLAGTTNWVDYVQIPVTNAVNTNLLIDFNPPPGMTLIPAGMFTIGNSVGDGDGAVNGDIPTNVTVSAFYMDTNLVSYGLWQPVYIWATNHGYGFYQSDLHPPYVAFGKTSNNPVGNIDWYDCVKWCDARSQQEGLTPVYYTDTNLTQIYTNGEWAFYSTVGLYVNWNANGYRLPTEAEWEKAARGGLTGCRFPWGNFISEDLANYTSDTEESYDLGPSGPNPIGLIGGMPGTSPVGSFPPNGYGLYDMAGNANEWCWDWFDAPTYPGSGPFPPGSAYLGGTDPHGPDSTPTSNRVLRGGFYTTAAYFMRTAFRGANTPDSYYAGIGFRCVRGL
jgi:formylglycine-generating enzyme